MARKPRNTDEPSAVEVQQMLAALDGNEGAALPELPVVEKLDPGILAITDNHVLDTCPINSKIVVTDQGAVLATPDLERLLPDGDLAHKLPEGTKIQKIAEGRFRGKLPIQFETPAIVAGSADTVIVALSKQANPPDENEIVLE